MTVAVVGGTLAFALPGLEQLQALRSRSTSPISAQESAPTLTVSEQGLDVLSQSRFCLTQSQHGRCTITSCAMLLRRMSYLDGSENWQEITEESLYPDAWIWGTGMRHRFTSFGYQVRSFTWSVNPDPEDRTRRLARLLEKHPEGLVIYDSRIPHAVLLTRYDAVTGTFYCADPAGGSYSGREIPLADSWNGHLRGGQDSVICSLARSWYIAGPAPEKNKDSLG
ncbi:MAG: hypothetical protein ACI4VV_02265 [Eggerthellaceae bacterium]